jgi:YHS domain-containing protein
MIKLLIIVAVGYLLYRSMRSWMFPNSTSLKNGSGKTAGEIDDVMIEDPYCKAYFPRRDAVHLSFHGSDLYFCSKSCRDRYIAHQPEEN